MQINTKIKANERWLSPGQVAGYRGSGGYSSVWSTVMWELQMSYTNVMIFGYLSYVNALAHRIYSALGQVTVQLSVVFH